MQDWAGHSQPEPNSSREGEKQVRMDGETREEAGEINL